MNIPEYLKSEQARADVARAVETREYTQAGPFPPLRHLVVMCQGAWSVVRFFCADLNGEGIDGGSMCVYFREDADRFIVTDLGEAVRALRLRTGMSFDDLVDKYVKDKTTHFQGPLGAIMDGTLLAGNWERGWIGEVAYHSPTEAQHLPAAICRVMLAAYEVARL